MLRLDTNVHSSLSETVTKSLNQRHIITIVDFVAADSIKLATFTGLSYTDVTEIKQHILNRFGAIKKNGAHLLETQLNDIISTNVTSLDELLKGGLYSGQICELCGPSSSGKSQLCLTIATSVAVRSDIIVWYIDTKRDFSVLRFEEILRARGFTQKTIKEALKRTKICYVQSFQQLLQALHRLGTLYTMKPNDIPGENKRLLVIVDSLPAIIFQVTRDRDKSDNKVVYELNDLANACLFLANKCRASVITVNLIIQWKSLNQTNISSSTATLGKYWSKVPTTRLMLMRLHNEIRKISVWKDLRLIENSFCCVTINDAGITVQ